MSAVVNAVHPEKILKDLGELWTSLGVGYASFSTCAVTRPPFDERCAARA